MQLTAAIFRLALQRPRVAVWRRWALQLTVVAASDSLLPDHMLLQGLLWVWMDSSAGATAASQQRQLPLPAELAAGPGEPPRGVLLGDW